MKKNKGFNYSKRSKINKDKINYPVKESASYDFDYPIFCFKYLSKSIKDCPKEHKEEFITRLFKLSKLSFKQINTSNRHQYGWEKINKKTLRINLPPFITEEVNFLYAYRYNGKKNPFLAYRRPNTSILHIIAIDYNFSAYNHS